MGRTMKDILVFGAGAVAALYLVNPTAGLLEFIPDVAPVIGNLDEVAATALLLNSLRYFGVDPTRLFVKEEQKQLPAREK